MDNASGSTLFIPPPCEIQWISKESGFKETPDTFPSVGICYFFSLTEARLVGVDPMFETKKMPICLRHFDWMKKNTPNNQTQWIFRRHEGIDAEAVGLDTYQYIELGEHMTDEQIKKLMILCERFNVPYKHGHYFTDRSCGKGWVSGWIGGELNAGKSMYIGVSPEGDSHS